MFLLVNLDNLRGLGLVGVLDFQSPLSSVNRSTSVTFFFQVSKDFMRLHPSFNNITVRDLKEICT